MGMKRHESGGSFEPCPEGQYAAVLADIIDRGWQERIFEGQSQGYQPMIQLVWQVNEDNADGKPYAIFDRKMKYSTHEKSSLYGRLCAWLGKKRVEQMIADDAEIESLLGTTAFIAVEHSQGADGTTYANVSTIMPLPKGMSSLQVRDYERWCERDSWENGDERGNPPRKPEYSAFDDPTTVRRSMAEAAGQQAMPLDVPQSRPATPQRPNGRPAEHPAAVNNPDTRKAVAREMAQGYGDDDDAVFDQEFPDGTPPALLNDVQDNRPVNTAHSR